MDFKQIEAFVNVVRYKSFSKAADATFFTQPTISTHISNLEKELGVKLLDRRGRNIDMTPKGATFYEYAVEMLNSRALAQDALNNSKEDISGILEIQTSSIPGVTFLPDYLAWFRAEHKHVQYYVTLSDTQTVIDNITERRGEIGFVGEKVTDSALEYVKIFTDRVVMISPKSYEIGNSIDMKEAIKYPFLWRETGSATRKSFEDTASKLGYDKKAFDIAGLFNDLDSIIRSVESGLGVAVLSKSVAYDLASDKIDIVDINDFSDERDFYMARLKGRLLSPVAEAFCNFILEKATPLIV